MSSLDSRVRKMTWALFGVAVSGLIGALLVGVVVVAQIRSAQVDRLPQNEKNDGVLAAIKDCTEPSGECFKRGQRQTAEVLASVQRIVVLSAACAVSVDAAASVETRVADITECVTRGLARESP